MTRWSDVVMAVVLAIASAAAPAAAQSKTVLKFAHITPLTFPYQDGALKFKEVAEKLSGGKIEVQVYPAAQLGGERDIEEGIRLGTIHVGIGAGALAGFAPIYNIVELPFLIRNQDHMVKVADGPAGRLLAKRIEEQSGFRVLGWWSTGDSGIETVKAPVRTPADLKGAKIRVMENKALIDSTRALGANPAPVPFPEVYTSLKQGVVDGAHLDYTALYTTKVYEAVKYVSEPGFHFLSEPRPLIMSAKYFDGLPPDVRDVLRKAAAESTAYERAVFLDKQAKAIAALRSHGLQFTTLDEPAFLAAVRPIWTREARALGAEDLLEEIVKAGK